MSNNIKPTVSIAMRDDRVYMVSNDDILNNDHTHDIAQHRAAEPGQKGGKYYISLPKRPGIAFMLRHSLKSCNVGVIDKETSQELKVLADQVPLPSATLDESKKRVEITIPIIPHYREIMRKVDAMARGKGNFSIPLSRAFDLYTVVQATKYKYPKIEFSQDLENFFNKPIPGFDGSIDSLKSVSTDEISVIRSNVQAPKARSKSKKTLSEKFAEIGIESLYDLLFELPRRYIDKSEPSKLNELIIGQDTTVIGTITEIETFNSGKGLNIDLDLHGGGSIRASFFAGAWMQNKYKEGSNVIITGKYKPWRKLKQIAGSTIEFSDSAATLPVTPIYSQSESKGITTTVISRAVQELIYRLGHVELPFYLKNVSNNAEVDDERSSRVVDKTYAELIRAVHFPKNMKEREDAIKRLAFYELVEMQLVIQGRKKKDDAKSSGVVHKLSENRAYASAKKNLPFELTGAQKKGLEQVEKGMVSSKPYHTLLNADVGAGKSVLATLSAFIAVDSGAQAAIIAPTEILARQLYQSVLSVKDNIDDDSLKSNIKVEFFTGSLKAKEKRDAIKRIKNGESNVIIGTKSVMSKDVEYDDLTFIAIDEQQKFGAEDRSALLSSRSDNKIPDLMMMTATPIPRSTAQVFYGDMDFIHLNEKPAGRLPIVTEWIEESPSNVVGNYVHSLWADVREEVEKGNKAFVIAPLVEDSEKIDSASVESTYENLKSGPLSGINIGYVHGKMKSEEAEKVMKDFKDGSYDILVASTVVEVGVDISEATRMIILSASRLGASSLHQIRGRVGRNNLQSKCYLVDRDVTDNGRERLQSIVDNEDGFEIAKSDLALRGEGTLFSASQSGKSEFTFLKLAKHGRWVKRAASHASHVLESDKANEAIDIVSSKFGNTDERFM